MFQDVQDTILSEKKKNMMYIMLSDFCSFFLNYLFYVFWAVLGLRCCEWILVVTSRATLELQCRLLSAVPSVATLGL